MLPKRLILAVLILMLVAVGLFVLERKITKVERPKAPEEAVAPTEQRPEAAPMTPVPTPQEAREFVFETGRAALGKWMEQPFPGNLDTHSEQMERLIEEAYRQRLGESVEQAGARIAGRSPETRARMIETCRRLEEENKKVPERYQEQLKEWQAIESSKPDDAKKAKGALFMSLYYNRFHHLTCKGVAGG